MKKERKTAKPRKVWYLNKTGELREGTLIAFDAKILDRMGYKTQSENFWFSLQSAKDGKENVGKRRKSQEEHAAVDKTVLLRTDELDWLLQEQENKQKEIEIWKKEIVKFRQENELLKAKVEALEKEVGKKKRGSIWKRIASKLWKKQ